MKAHKSEPTTEYLEKCILCMYESAVCILCFDKLQKMVRYISVKFLLDARTAKDTLPDDRIFEILGVQA